MRRSEVFIAFMFGLAVFLCGAASASAAAPAFLLQVPSESVFPGAGAGQLNNPRGMAVDPASGHVYVSDLDNARIDEFTVWGGFVKAWGWDVAPEGAPGDTAGNEFEICTTVCKAGVKANGVGQFNQPLGVTVDGAGSLYVYESQSEGEKNFRVQKFDSTGHFLLMFGGEVNKTTKANICTKAEVEGGDECGAGIPGGGDGQFSNGSVRNYISFNSVSNTILVGDVSRIQEFNSDGTFKSKIDLEGTLAGRTVEALATDPMSGDLYAAFASTPNVYRLDRVSGEIHDELPVDAAKAVAVDAAGTVYVVRGSGLFDGEVLGFSASGTPVEGMETGDGFPGEGTSPGINGLTTNVECQNGLTPGDLYVDFFISGERAQVNVYGPSGICFEDPPKVPPEIKAQYAVSVDTRGAMLKAQVNPRFWPDATYYVQYGTGKCSEGGCEKEQPAPPGASLTTKSTSALVTTAGVLLSSLSPATTYHYRFVAQSSGGGPVRGVGGTELSDGEESTFTTFRLATANAACPANDSFRNGASAKLPDCRAYEMVSPLDKNNADVQAELNASGYPTELDQSSLSGEKLTYSASTAFNDPESAPFTSQYLAERAQEGWASEPLSPPHTRLVIATAPLENEFEAFSLDLCSGWLQTVFDPPLVEGAVAGFRNLYQRKNCAGGGYEALGPGGVPQHQGSNDYKMRLQGASADGSRTIFVADDNLTGSGAPENANRRLQLYERGEGGQPSFVCILPSGNATKQPCSAGTADEKLEGGAFEHTGSFQNAISADGTRVFWTETEEVEAIGRGKIFVRFEGEPKSRRVSQSVSSAKSRFWGAAADGSVAIFAIEDSSFGVNENLYSFEVEADKATKIAGGVKGVLGISDDASRVYFASKEVIPGAGKNSEGDEAVGGETNIYLYHQEGDEHTYSFVATPAAGELNAGATSAFNPISRVPFYRTARVSPDGRHAAFMSRTSLTGYDNTDAASGEADEEVFLYDAEGGKLRCASCNPSGARPSGIDLHTIIFKSNHQWAAARIPGWETPLYASRALSDDGKRLFFESFEALLPSDTNGVGDVYEWEAKDSGSCTEDDATFAAVSEGCIELISSGEGPRESTFIDADPSGKNVFFATLSSLVPLDYGLVDIYDARVGGGFAYPEPQPPCEGEACQSPPAPPDDPTPSSANTKGAGNFSAQRCGKGRRRIVVHGKARCAKTHKHHHKRKQKRQHGSAAR